MSDRWAELRETAKRWYADGQLVSYPQGVGRVYGYFDYDVLIAPVRPGSPRTQVPVFVCTELGLRPRGAAHADDPNAGGDEA